MLRFENSGRYNTHELLRQYAKEKLNETPQIKEMVLNRHGEYYAQFLSQRESQLESDQQRHALKEILEDVNNIRAAWNHNVKQKNFDLVSQSLQNLVSFYSANAWFQEGADMFARAIVRLRLDTLDSTTGTLLGRLLTAQGICLNWMGQVDRAKDLFHEGLGLIRSHGTEVNLMRTLNEGGLAAYQRGEFRQAETLLQESLSIATKRHGDNPLTACGYHYLCLTYLALHKFELAKQAGEKCLRLYQQLGLVSGLCSIVSTLGALFMNLGLYQEANQVLRQWVTSEEKDWSLAERSRYLEVYGALNYALGDYELARQQLEASLALAQEINIPRRLTWTLYRLGDLDCTLGNYDVAHQRFEEAIRIAGETGQTWQHLLSQHGLGRVAYYQGNYVVARQLQEKNLRLCLSLNFQREKAKILKDLGLIATALENNADARRYFYEALKIGQSSNKLPTMLEILVGIAELFMIEGKYPFVAKLLDVSLHHPASLADTRQYAEQIQVQLQAVFPQGAYVHTQHPVQGSDLEPIITELLNILAHPDTDDTHTSIADTLTPRELEVLRLLATRRTNREISDKLVISIGTVKTHVHNICNKLGVSGRNNAVERARDLHLL